MINWNYHYHHQHYIIHVVCIMSAPAGYHKFRRDRMLSQESTFTSAAYISQHKLSISINGKFPIPPSLISLLASWHQQWLLTPRTQYWFLSSSLLFFFATSSVLPRSRRCRMRWRSFHGWRTRIIMRMSIVQSSQASLKNCDFTAGKWIFDQSYPLYDSRRCPYLTTAVTCAKNGRPDSDYEKWRWKPNGCTIPRQVTQLEIYKLQHLWFMENIFSQNIFFSNLGKKYVLTCLVVKNEFLKLQENEFLTWYFIFNSLWEIFLHDFLYYPYIYLLCRGI